MILLIDNYDSFTYNLYQYMGIFYNDIKVVRNDQITIEEIRTLDPERIVLSPGPKSPMEAGICASSAGVFSGDSRSVRQRRSNHSRSLPPRTMAAAQRSCSAGSSRAMVSISWFQISRLRAWVSNRQP